MASTDRIEKVVELAAPPSRVWRAVTDAKQFGEWFRLAIDGEFVAGTTVVGKNLWPGYEHLHVEMAIVTIEPERYFAYRWHPYPADPKRDYSGEPMTLVELTLAPSATGTRLTITESGFDQIPADRRADAWRANDGGWSHQAGNLKGYVEK